MKNFGRSKYLAIPFLVPSIAMADPAYFADGIEVGSGNVIFPWQNASMYQQSDGAIILESAAPETADFTLDGGVAIAGDPVQIYLGSPVETEGGFEVWRGADWGFANVAPLFAIDSRNLTAEFTNVDVSIASGDFSVGGSQVVTAAGLPAAAAAAGLLNAADFENTLAATAPPTGGPWSEKFVRPNSDGDVFSNGSLVLGLESSSSPNVLNSIANSIVIGGGNDLGSSIFTGGSGMILGSDNEFTGFSQSSIIMGEQNSVGSSKSLVMGDQNELRSTYSSASSGRVIMNGMGNFVDTFTSSLVVGNGNHLEASSGQMGFYSAAIGSDNEITSQVGWTTGIANKIQSAAGTAHGWGLVNDSWVSVMVGHFNETLNSDPENRVEEDPVFVVGNGSDDLNRSNALVVKRNGDIVIPKAQGDISMGIYD